MIGRVVVASLVYILIELQLDRIQTIDVVAEFKAAKRADGSFGLNSQPKRIGRQVDVFICLPI